MDWVGAACSALVSFGSDLNESLPRSSHGRRTRVESYRLSVAAVLIGCWEYRVPHEIISLALIGFEQEPTIYRFLLTDWLTDLLTTASTRQHSVYVLQSNSKHNNAEYNSLPQSILVVLVKWRHRANALLCTMFKLPTFFKIHINFIFWTFTNWHFCNFYCALPSTMCFFAFSSNVFDTLKAATMLMWACLIIKNTFSDG